MAKVLCFGEILLRLSPQEKDDWIWKNQLGVHIGGAELNVASALAVWGHQVKYYTALPDNFIAQDIINALGHRSIDTSLIQLSGSRVGIYYLMQGQSIGSNTVVYDRTDSSFSNLKPAIINWDELFEDVSWFHFSAICPALNEDIAEVCEEALQAANQKGIIVSIDLNYREKLWQPYRNRLETMSKLVKYCNVVMGNIWAAQALLGIEYKISNNAEKSEYLEAAFQVSAAIKSRFSHCKTVANTFRFTGDKIRYYAAAHIDTTFVYSKEWHTHQIINRVGSGDCFMAGLIHGLSKALAPQQIIDFAAAAAFGKLQETGDATQQSENEIIQRLTHG
jgi:2-dehydro-3-deoxygluconokinase